MERSSSVAHNMIFGARVGLQANLVANGAFWLADHPASSFGLPWAIGLAAAAAAFCVQEF